MNTKQLKSFLPALVAAGLMMSACGGKKEDNATKPEGIDLANIDTTIRPQDDFFAYVNGGWLKNNPIPESESAWGSFHVLRDQVQKNIRTILDEAANDKSVVQGSVRQKIGDYYASGMDSVKLNQDGTKPLTEELARIEAIKTTDDIAPVVAHFHAVALEPLFATGIGPDPKISSQNITTVGQGGMGLPSTDYYTSMDESMVKIREEYVNHIQNLLTLLGDKPDAAKRGAATVMRIETGLASKAMTPVEQRDIEAQYNKKTLEEFVALTPNLALNKYLAELQINNIKEIIVAQPAFFQNLNVMLKTMPLEDWKTYLRWHLIHGTASKLSDEVVAENFNFYGKVLSGAKQLRPRWKRVADVVDAGMGEALGQLYVEKYFSPESKKRVNEMVDNLTAAYRERIKTRDWMSAETKKKAEEKLNMIIRKLAYPDKWKDYSALTITRESYVGNFLRANETETKRAVAKLGKPIDKTEWGMSPATVNAYYNPSFNEIVFPAGIMGIPFFNPNADDAVNYGCMGAVIGHELTHGFDDQGSQFDGEGNLKDWWTTSDKENFKKKAQVVVDQFNKYVAVDSMTVNGELTLGENIADLGGLTMAYYAYKKSLEGKPEPKKVDGLAGEQRFFISWAQGWRANYRPEALKHMVNTNPHSPPVFRVVGPLSNMKEFYAAFGVKEGDKMFKPEAERAEIW